MHTIHQAPTLPRRLATLLPEVHAALDEVATLTGRPLAPWTGTLRRVVTARTVAASTAIEGYAATQRDTVRILEGQSPEAAPRDTADAIGDYRRAMDRVAGLATDHDFAWDERVVQELHFLATASASRSLPGRWRETEVHVHRAAGTPYEPPPAAAIPTLMRAAATQQRSDLDPLVNAAMVHLHVSAVHPFMDGNGRTARILHALVLARARLLPLDVCSIEAQLAADTDGYYAALRSTNGVHRLGGPEYYDPSRSVEQWLDFCLQAHAESARAALDEVRTARARHDFCLRLVRTRNLPERLAEVLDQALADLPITNETHRLRQNVAVPTATQDLRRLVDLGWLDRHGTTRSTRYTPSASLRARWARERSRLT